MKVLLTANAHIFKNSKGEYFTPSIYNQDFFNRYLNIFDEVRFVAKTKYVESLDYSKYIKLNLDGLEIYELPWYQGFKELILNLFKLINKIRNVNEGCDCCIYRVAQIESYLVFLFSKNKKKYFAVEVVNDPQTFVDIPFFFRFINVIFLKKMVKKANGVSYVTKNYLQNLYPSLAQLNGEDEKHFETYYSSVELLKSDIRVPKRYINTKNNFEIIHVSNAINDNIKGHITFFKVIKNLIDKGYNIKGCCIGDGKMLNSFKDFSKTIKIYDHIDFVGKLSNRKEVLDRLEKSDLLVLPTFLEGLPRTIIESMAVGLPCISTPIAGIPELLDKRYLFNPTDINGFTDIIIELINNPLELEKMSKENLNTAKSYTKEKLTDRRNWFYSKLKTISEFKE